jgi:hypothetical protein
MFILERRGLFGRKPRLKSARRLDVDDFRALCEMLRKSPIRARKIGYVAARRAQMRQHFETHWNGKESEITAEIGDWIVTTLSPAGAPMRDAEGHLNTYAIKPERFNELYEATDTETEFGRVYRAKGVVEALFLSGGFEIEAPWGEKQSANAGYLLLSGNEVYGNNRDTFEATYAVMS